MTIVEANDKLTMAIVAMADATKEHATIQQECRRAELALQAAHDRVSDAERELRATIRETGGGTPRTRKRRKAQPELTTA